MIFGMTTFTFIHVVLSLIGIVAGFVVLFGFFKANRLDGWTAAFLLTTSATVLTGFGFPFSGFTPAIGVGIISTIVLAAAIAARYAFHMTGIWRPVYIVSAVIALYFNFFVLIVQSFLKIPALHALAPNGSEPPFALAQGAALLFFLFAGAQSLKRFRPAAA